jgi:hypothetical protein
MDHDAITGRRLARADRHPGCLNDSAWFMALDDQFRFGARWTVQVVKIAAAHAGRLHADDHLIWSRDRVWRLAELELPFT